MGQTFPEGINLGAHSGVSLLSDGNGGLEIRSRGAKVGIFNGSVIGLTANGPTTVSNKRKSVSIADINAGVTLLPAVGGFKYRMISCTAIAIGGNAGTVTTVDVLGTQSGSSIKLVAYAQASLLRSAVLKDGGTGAAVLADGQSYTQMDANTAITVGKTGGAIDTATAVDINIVYTLEA